MFVARELVAAHVDVPDELFAALLAGLLARGSDSLSNTLAPAVARQEALVALLERCPRERYQEDRVLLQAEEVGFYAVAELLKIYPKDAQRAAGVFALVRQLMHDAALTDEQRGAIRAFTLASLIEVDPAAAALLMIDVLAGQRDVHQADVRRPRSTSSTPRPICWSVTATWPPRSPSRPD